MTSRLQQIRERLAKRDDGDQAWAAWMILAADDIAYLLSELSRMEEAVKEEREACEQAIAAIRSIESYGRAARDRQQKEYFTIRAEAFDEAIAAIRATAPARSR